MFEVDSTTAANNYHLVKFLKGLLGAWNNKSDKFKQAFYDESGLSTAEVKDMLTYGRFVVR